MLFSVLIANYNNSKFLRDSLNSVLCQSHTDWEIILVDDGSTDDFEQAIAPYKNHSRIRIYRNDRNFGCGYTKRRCAELATGTLAGFLDPDDALVPDALKIMHDHHHKMPECSLIHSTHYICNEQLTAKRIAEYPRALPENIPYLLLNDGRVHHFASFRKKCYDETGGISPVIKKAVDQDLYYRLEETGKIFFIEQPLYYYRIHENSISTSGKEADATRWHYTVIEDACLRRIKHFKEKKDPAARHWIKKYRTRYYKIRIFRSFRERKWPAFFRGLFMFPFIGGFGNTISYLKKLPKQRLELLKKSFTDNYEIKA